MGIAADPAGDYVYVVSTNFDAGKTGSTVVPVSVETNEILAGSAIEIGSFAGEIAVAEQDGVGVVGYVAVREGDVIEYFDIDRSSGVPVLRCGPRPDDGSLALCDAGHEVEPIGAPQDLIGTHKDPFALALGASPDGGDRWLYSGSIVDGTFSVLPLGHDMKPVPGQAVKLEAGLHSIVEGPVIDGHRRVYASNRMTNALHVLDVWSEAGVPRIRVLDALQVAQVSASGNFFRGLALSKDKRTLYAAFHSPASLAVIDIDAEGNADMRGLIPLGESPAGVAVAHDDGSGEDRVYVTDYMGDSVYSVDPMAMDVVGRTFVNEGPYGITIVRNKGLNLHRAYVTCFEEGKVDVIDVDPTSDTYDTVVAVIPADADQGVE
ncbi:MAG: hypothetical protein GXP54_13880, partial [Deltaproteobacteria bacterium]|nr:hypothetical protein [Deltaproteobacteria bacterium]